LLVISDENKKIPGEIMLRRELLSEGMDTLSVTAFLNLLSSYFRSSCSGSAGRDCVSGR
jgi:hypothetical protein